MKWYIPTLALAAGRLVPAARADDADVKKGLEKLQGTWKVESITVGGNKAPKEAAEKITLVVAGDKITVKDGEKNEEATIKIDPTKKPPTIDFTPVKDVKNTALGLYELDGDNLKLCWIKDGKARPTAVESKEGSEVVLFVLKREKK